MTRPLPISPKYRKPVFEAVGLQLLVGFFSLLILDGGTTARICGIALVGFWGGASWMIWRRPETPTRIDLQVTRFGYLPVVLVAYFLMQFIWAWRGAL